MGITITDPGGERVSASIDTRKGMPPQLGEDGLEVVRNTLRTSVSDILRVNVGQLTTLPQHEVYDHILNTPGLLHECFQVFRAQPDLFRKVMVRKDKRPVTGGDDELWCGRTLDHVVALVVRASARRYFCAALPAPDLPPRPAEPAPSLLHRTDQ